MFPTGPKGKDLLRREVPLLVEDSRLKPELDIAAKMVREGACIDAVGKENLRSI